MPNEVVKHAPTQVLHHLYSDAVQFPCRRAHCRRCRRAAVGQPFAGRPLAMILRPRLHVNFSASAA